MPERMPPISWKTASLNVPLKGTPRHDPFGNELVDIAFAALLEIAVGGTRLHASIEPMPR